MHPKVAQRKFPAWAGPTIGLLIGAFFGAKALSQEGQLEWEYVVWSAAIGAAGGSLFLLQDLTCRHRISPAQLPDPDLAKFLAISQLFVGFVPLAGWVYSSVASF